MRKKQKKSAKKKSKILPIWSEWNEQNDFRQLFKIQVHHVVACSIKTQTQTALKKNILINSNKCINLQFIDTGRDWNWQEISLNHWEILSIILTSIIFSDYAGCTIVHTSVGLISQDGINFFPTPGGMLSLTPCGMCIPPGHIIPSEHSMKAGRPWTPSSK